MQVVATTHSPYLLDLFRDHPQEVVIAEKAGAAATFTRLSEHPHVDALLAEGTLGDLWRPWRRAGGDLSAGWRPDDPAHAF